MKERMVSRVTATARLWGKLPSPAKGLLNGTRTMAVTIWPANPIRSVVAIGHDDLATPGRWAITTGRLRTSWCRWDHRACHVRQSGPTPWSAAARPDSDRLGGQGRPQAEQLVGGSSQGQLDLLGQQEIAMQRVVAIHPYASVEVDGGVHHPLASVGGPKFRHRHRVLGRKPFSDSPCRLPGGEPDAVSYTHLRAHETR